MGPPLAYEDLISDLLHRITKTEVSDQHWMARSPGAGMGTHMPSAGGGGKPGCCHGKIPFLLTILGVQVVHASV